MKLLLRAWILILTILLVGCDDETVEREIGYKGKARLNQWLAAERLMERYGEPVESTLLWQEPSIDQCAWIMPMAMLSNATYVRSVEEWILGGGHLILVAEQAEQGDDWHDGPTPETTVDPALEQFFERFNVKFESKESASVTEIRFQRQSYKVDANSKCRVSMANLKPGVFSSRTIGSGRLTVVTDGRIFRNRWISDQEHAAFFKALIDASPRMGAVGFMRGSELSLWDLVIEHLWAVLLALGVLIALWLWKCLPRFGPLEPNKREDLQRSYDHHLEALGFYQWRLDKAVSLLAPLRALILERGQRLSVKSGRRDDDFFQFLADQAGLPRERVLRALTESAPADAAVLTRTTADLQRLLQLLN